VRGQRDSCASQQITRKIRIAADGRAIMKANERNPLRQVDPGQLRPLE
jgi:hypothetical protein